MEGQPRQEGTGQGSRRPGRLAASGTKQPLNLRMDTGVIHRLKRHALDRGRTVSDVVTELVLGHLGDDTPLGEVPLPPSPPET
jgi:hypothetical protein